MRVIMVTPGYYPIKGGTETVVRSLSRLLNRTGVHTDIMTFNMNQKWSPHWKGKTEKTDEMTVFKVPALNWLPIAHSPRITQGVNLIPGRFTNILKEYDLVHFHEADFSFPLFSTPVRKPKIFHLHGLCMDFLKRYHLSRFILKHTANLYISVSEQMKKELTSLGIPKEKIVCVPNGVDVELFRPAKEKEDNMLLFVGRITFAKGLHVLVESLRYLKDPVQLVMIGPADWDRSYSQDVLCTKINQINAEGRHRITHLGSLDQADIVQWYQKASMFVLPSFSEGFPVTILEALSCETPVVATTVGGVAEIVRDFENGFLVPPNNPIRLAGQIQYLLDNKNERTRLGLEGRKLVVNSFSMDKAVNKLCQIYEQLSND